MRAFFDHVEFRVRDFETSLKFYKPCLSALGFLLIVCDYEKKVFGFGLTTTKSADLLLTAGGVTTPPTHIAFTADSMEKVNEFYLTAVSAGGVCNGGPGWRSENYYAAYVLDPDGHNVEAVFRKSIIQLSI